MPMLIPGNLKTMRLSSRLRRLWDEPPSHARGSAARLYAASRDFRHRSERRGRLRPSLRRVLGGAGAAAARRDTGATGAAGGADDADHRNPGGRQANLRRSARADPRPDGRGAPLGRDRRRRADRVHPERQRRRGPDLLARRRPLRARRRRPRRRTDLLLRLRPNRAHGRPPPPRLAKLRPRPTPPPATLSAPLSAQPETKAHTSILALTRPLDDPGASNAGL